MIILYQGARGRGKTLSMTKDAYKYHLAGWNIVSNMESLGFAKYMSPEDMLSIDKNFKLDNCVLVIDEIQSMFDSRRSGAKENIKFSVFIQQIRKRGMIFLATTQYANTVDLRFRQHLDIVAVPNFNKNFNVCEVMYVDITTQEDALFGIVEPKVASVVYDARDIFKLYNDKELIR